MAKYKETDMYEPVHKLLVSQGFTVRGEVKGCDVAAVRGDVLWIVEMKLSANLTLIFQALERKAATDWVFVAIPRPKNARVKSFKQLKQLLTKLHMGLITVAIDSPLKLAEIVLLPCGQASKNTKSAANVLKELSGRNTDTVGGGKGIVNTAYRERCIRIACLIEANGPVSAKQLVKINNCEKDSTNILQKNFYAWFNRIERGIYELSHTGQLFLHENTDTSIVAYYRAKAENIS